MEIWKAIKDYEERYEVSDFGNVRNIQTGRTLKLISYKGYHHVGLHKDGKGIRKQVHRLVAQAFIPNPCDKPLVNHINGVKNDNRVENLEWATIQENSDHYHYSTYNKRLYVYDEQGNLIFETDLKNKRYKIQLEKKHTCSILT